MLATRPYAHESRPRSWFHLVSTLAVLAGFAAVAAAAPAWPLRLLGSLGTALTMVRMFILLHDVHHGAIFRGSKVATAVLHLYGLVLLTPARIWRETHNYHHAHTARTDGLHRGTFTLLTTHQWREAGFRQRLFYRIERHPAIQVFGYLTAFFLGFGVFPFLRHPVRYRDSGLAILVHVAIAAAVWLLAGPTVFLFAFLLPFFISGAVGTYLFYVQHNFEGVRIPTEDAWNHTDASLAGSSYLKLGPVMRWFTGNIGFHHVHHLNPHIPFYRLPAAMAEVPELQDPVVVTLSPRAILASLRLKLWDPEAGRMVGYAAAAQR